MERSQIAHNATSSHANSRKDNSLSASQASTNHTPASSASNKKWSFGRLFRRKKDIASDSSSEEDRKAGFVPTQRNARHATTSSGGGGGSSANLKTKSSNKSSKVSRSSKLNGASFDHIVINPQTGALIAPPHPPQPQHVDHEFFLPVETISPTEAYYQNQQQQQQYLPHAGAHPAIAAYMRSSNSLDRRAARAAVKTRSAQRLPHEKALGAHSSSEEELISLNSSTFSKYRSDESIHSGGMGAANNAQSRRSRAARNERYYKRLSRDGEPSSGQVPVMYAPQPTQRWKTQPVPLSIYNPSAQATPPSAAAQPRLRNTSSLQHVAPYVQWGQLQQQQQPKNLQNSVNDSKRSISYDSHIHLQNVNGRLQTKPLPPPPPPRDPLRRVNVSGQLQNGSAGDLRPISYAFDQSGLPALPTATHRLSGRCVSDDKIWSGPAGPHYQSVHSLNTPPAVAPAQHMQAGTPQQAFAPSNTPHHRRFITRAERDAHPSKKSLPNGLEHHYVADATPRSRKPIHMLEPHADATSKDAIAAASILRTTKSGLPSPSSQQHANDFWKRLDAGAQHRGRDVQRTFAPESNAKPRSVSSSRVGELRAYPIPVYSEVQKPHKKPQSSPQPAVDEVDNIVCGSLRIKSKPDNSSSNYVEIRSKDYSKSSSMPNHYQRRSGEIPNTPNKYDEYVAEKREQHHKPIFTPPTPPQRKLSIPPSSAAEVPIYFPRKKPANLEEAINELEAIYKSLGLTEEPEKKERIPTPSEFEKYALAHADEYDDEDSPAGEPDPIRDDVAYRNMQLANLQHKTVEKQPPFGIPIGPVVAAPQNDYLHVTSIVEPTQPVVVNTPDIIKDDLAVRALRKDPPGPKDKFMYPYSSFQKKNRATRTQSANIYNLIHRDAAKPSGGDLHSYLELTRNLDRAGSMSDLRKDDSETTADVPATLALLRNLKEQDQQQLAAPKKLSIPFRHPSQGGAICALPEKLPSSSVAHKEEVHKPPVPLPRKSLTPEPTAANAQMEDALNKIAMDAQEKSVKLTKELQELRKEALITAARPPKANTEEEKLEKDLQEIEAVSEAAKRCGKMLLDTLPDANSSQALAKPRKLHKEGKLIEAIDQVSEAANAVCEKILKDIVTTEPPVVVQEAVQVKNITQAKQPDESLVMPNLIKKLDPIQSKQIEAIAKRCMRQLSELASGDDNPDYDNLNQELQQSAASSVQASSAAAAVATCNAEHIHSEPAAKVDNIVCTVAEEADAARARQATTAQNIEEIDQIMLECEAKMRQGATTVSKVSAPPIIIAERTLGTARQGGATTHSSGDDHTTAPSITTSSCSSSNNAGVGGVGAGAVKTGASTTASSFSSSSDCLAKSSSPSASRRQSSSITSFNPYSSSDYIKSPSSEYHAPSTDPIKTFSTTSYDVPSTTSATPNISATTNSTFSYSPSPPPPPLNLTPVSARAIAATTVTDAATRHSQERARTRSLSSPSQYNSSEELAMIFGIGEQSSSRRSRTREQQQQSAQPSTTNVSGKDDDLTTTKSVHAPPAPVSVQVPLTSSNHAFALHHASMLDTATTTTTTTTAAKATQLHTNPNAVAVELTVAKAYACAKPSTTNKPEHLNVIVVVDNVNDRVSVVDVENVTGTTTTKNPISTSTIATKNSSTKPTHSDTKSSPTMLSPSSCKLASIPESPPQVESAPMECATLKLSPNFNKIYASKISIVVDKVTAEAGRMGVVTQCDSLSSGEEETSSNPDSGNVSLADFPLCAQTNNACLQLESVCNSRFEVRKNFVSEVSIVGGVSKEVQDARSVGEAGADVTEFPPPPSEEELRDSLGEEKNENGLGNGACERVEAEQEIERELKRENQEDERVEVKASDHIASEAQKEHETRVGSRLEVITKKHSTSDIFRDTSTHDREQISLEDRGDSFSSEVREPPASIDDSKFQNSTPIKRKISRSDLLEVDDTQHLIELAQLVRSSGSRRNSASASDVECSTSESQNRAPIECAYKSPARISTELDHLRLAFSELLQRNLTEVDELPSIVEEEDAVECCVTASQVARSDESSLNLTDKAYDTLPPRKRSIVFETPPLNLNISEVKISYCPTDSQESDSCPSDTLTQIAKCTTEVEQLNSALSELPQSVAAEEEEETEAEETRDDFKPAASTVTGLLPWRRRKSTLVDGDGQALDDEKPSTSAAAAKNQRHALSVFGELRPAAGAAAAAAGSLTTLEHVLLACSLGVITPIDLYTMCLIIIGMITIIAIVLF
ncbi:uncharacterized protein LOC118753903 isoform X2 [Rhagoletis pomonella]|uniref:uncharacterized protein LOC118753875 isoform X2 n=1 Tax=Rhagoletis pomonella TaxID=28610 RepID=UPI001784FF3E|nr:uncharacterized protein LOC118753875 isoform X2 [Rhagoletis pomonella]XP_036344644.1 uncharacterized protein LOC118753876 isoform X2 [Rhagoletis pomonella]XP_036344672.1 uncharacterized protein LOC118753902 isoform X2 [Rhagoletis pomonella]XP_036344674.1 uncharacterized protein LOC118753903 isoform X2 [Rhagoletis pomonella]